MQPFESGCPLCIHHAHRNPRRFLLGRLQDIEGFINLWFKHEYGSLIFSSGIYAESGALPSLRIIITKNQFELAELYFPLAELQEFYPCIIPIDRYIEGFSSTGKCLFNELAFMRFESDLGFKYNELLQGMLGPRAALLEVILSYVLAEHGEVYLSRYKQENTDCIGPPDFASSSSEILRMSLLYQSPNQVAEVTPTFGCFLYVYRQ